MEDFSFKPKYSFVNIYVGVPFSLVGSIFFLYLGVVGRSVASLLFSGLFIYAFISAFYIYPREIVLRSHEIIVNRLLFPHAEYSLYDITKIRFLLSCIEFKTGKLYFGSMIGQNGLLQRILKRMQERNIPINIDEEMEIDTVSLIDSLEE